jgi:hypothetical protein
MVTRGRAALSAERLSDAKAHRAYRAYRAQRIYIPGPADPVQFNTVVVVVGVYLSELHETAVRIMIWVHSTWTRPAKEAYNSLLCLNILLTISPYTTQGN